MASSAGFTGINVSARGNGTHTVLMKNNTVRNYDAGGIVLEVVDANTSAPVQLTLNASLIGNLVAELIPIVRSLDSSRSRAPFPARREHHSQLKAGRRGRRTE